MAEMEDLPCSFFLQMTMQKEQEFDLADRE